MLVRISLPYHLLDSLFTLAQITEKSPTSLVAIAVGKYLNNELEQIAEDNNNEGY